MRALDLSVAVITSETRPISNALWYAAETRTRELRIIGGPNHSDQPVRASQVVLPEVDLGRGLVYRHLRGLNRYLDRMKADVIHTNCELWSVTAQELLRRPESLIVHGAENIWKHGNPLESRARHALVRRALRRIDGYASWNVDGAGYVADRTNRRIPTLTIPAIIPPPEFRTRTWRDPGGEKFEVLLVGSLIPRKGFDTVIEAVGSLASTTNYRLSICGTGHLQETLRAQAARLGVEVCFVGQLEPADLAARMLRSHCLVQPSVTGPDWSEQFGRSVAEAMTIGLPCLVSTSGELPRVVAASSSVFAERDYRTLARLLEDLRTHPGRLSALVSEQSLAARRWSPAHAADAVARYWEDVRLNRPVHH